MMNKILFLDRDGTLVEEPSDYQVDSLEKVRLMPGVISALLQAKKAGYKFIIVSNQDGLGTDAFPKSDFDKTHSFIERIFSSQGITFADQFFCPHLDSDKCECRKPRAGLLKDFLANNQIDRIRSAVIGDRASDLELANNIGLKGFLVSRDGSPRETWDNIIHELLIDPRRAKIVRETLETNIVIEVDLDRSENSDINTGIGFFDHMLEQLAKHGDFSLSVNCDGDLDVDEHHTVEDVALTLGQCIKEALGDKRGIQRYGFVLPMDESQAMVAIDLGGRPFSVFRGAFPRKEIGGLPTEMIPHFFGSFAETLGAGIHIEVNGENTHHMVECCFKGLARSLKQAFIKDGNKIPSTKGIL
ncbi:MAG: bifunctional histidinol-phosphatase/imidazoleglycerol-phosphate dehydratase [Rhodospirillaceae bacterium]|nr:bifunctional histidinol-phosphatase/imidazoleglycerol-phosphate dehydratase [Rhodospirillaceae bacterium]|tara:strand:- start:193 stop:1266 length:1074 start_codon:yes stop_codon:yes gene_type:complete